MSITKSIKTQMVVKIEKSWKFEGYCFITLQGGKCIKRKVYDRKTGKFAGLHLVNVNTDVYSFEWEANSNLGTNIDYVGSYKNMADIEDEIVINPTIFKQPDPVKYEIEGEVRHEEFEAIKACVELDVPVYLVGPAGSGKNHTLEAIANDLNIDFYFTNSVQQEFKITGFIDAGGHYHETEFYKAFTNGGLFFLDEMDASIPEVLVLLNAAIANKYFEFPNGKVVAHETFRVVAAGNTFGNGSDEQYTGRLVLDSATLDRFAVIHFDYSERIELHLAKGDKDLVDFIRNLRKKSTESGIRATYSYRAITAVVKLSQSLPLDKVLTIAVFKGLDKDTVNMYTIYGMQESQYTLALKRVQA